MTIDEVIARLRKLALKEGTIISGIKASSEEVLDTTGVHFLEIPNHRFLPIFRNARNISRILVVDKYVSTPRTPENGLLTTDLSTACPILTDGC